VFAALAARLEKLISECHVRTVINLRGSCPPCDWYFDECRTTQDHGVSQEDVCLSAGRLPPTHELRRLVEIFERGEPPFLIHCFRGADRTGLASAVALLLTTDTPLKEARGQLGPRYGHLALGRPANLDRFLDLYSQWLDREQLLHSRAAFRRWAVMAYCPGPCRARLELLSADDGLLSIGYDEPAAFRVRCYNTSVLPWNLRAGSNAGINVMARVVDPRGGGCLMQVKAGLFEAEVPPGSHVDVTVALPPLRRPGRHRLLIDLNDERQGYFYQAGSEPLERELEVREQPTQDGNPAGGHGVAAGLPGLQGWR
jgi:hypothetical protein